MARTRPGPDADGVGNWSMREIARFVAEKLSTLEGVLSTSTHFHLKTYKKNGCVFEAPVQTERLAVAP